MSAVPASHDEAPPEELSRPILSMTDKQLYTSVRNGQRITFHIFDAEPVSGYLAGLDEERLFVLEPLPDGTFDKQFISRTMGSPIFKIHSDRAYRDEPAREEMDLIIGPFRQWVGINTTGQRPRSTRGTRSHPNTERHAS